MKFELEKRQEEMLKCYEIKSIDRKKDKLNGKQKFFQGNRRKK